MHDQLAGQDSAPGTVRNLTVEPSNLKEHSEPPGNLSTYSVSAIDFTTANSARKPSKSALRAFPILKNYKSHGEIKRDSAISSSTKDSCMEPLGNEMDTAKLAGNVPQIVIDHEEDAKEEKGLFKRFHLHPTVQKPGTRPATATADLRAQQIQQEAVTRPSTASHFRGIDTEIPSINLSDLSELSNLQFSRRGTLLLHNKQADAVFKSTGLSELSAKAPAKASSETPAKASSKTPADASTTSPQPRRQPSAHRLEQFQGADSRFLSADDAMLSQKLRSMYETGNENVAEQFLRPKSAAAVNTKTSQNDTLGWQTGESSLRPLSSVSAPFAKEEYETAGGIEDWEDINGEDVDRYGFIIPVEEDSPNTSRNSSSPRPRMHRVSTSLQLASQTPRRKRTIRRSPSNAQSSRSANHQNSPFRRRASRKSFQPAGSLLSGHSTSSRKSTSQSRYRIATNKLPHNRRRRIVDEAGDMLTLPPGLPDIEEEGKNNRIAHKIKSKEWSREQKWRKMARPVAPNESPTTSTTTTTTKTGGKGGGMTFAFDTRDPKLISRTWKGVPDRWRASAWQAFLAASAQRRQIGETDAQLVERYYALQEEDSRDDVQIDTDVPRTISDHVMFRKRYRGGYESFFLLLLFSWLNSHPIVEVIC